MQPSVEAAANEVLAAGWNGIPPVDVDALASDLSVRGPDGVLVPVELSYQQHRRRVSASAQLIAEDGQSYQFRCIANAREPRCNQRFAIAHALGHIALGHLDFERTDLEDQGFSAATPHEQEANAFAMALLMPERAVRHAIEKEQNILRLADWFEVAPVTMRNRLEGLGLIEQLAEVRERGQVRQLAR